MNQLGIMGLAAPLPPQSMFQHQTMAQNLALNQNLMGQNLGQNLGKIVLAKSKKAHLKKRIIDWERDSSQYGMGPPNVQFCFKIRNGF